MALPALFYYAVYRFTRPVGRLPGWSYGLLLPLPLATSLFIAERAAGEELLLWVYALEALTFLVVGLLALVASQRLLKRHQVNTRAVNADVEQTDLAWLLKVVPAIGVLLLCGTISIFLWETNYNWQLAANTGIVLVLMYFIVYKVREREIYTPPAAAFVEDMENSISNEVIETAVATTTAPTSRTSAPAASPTITTAANNSREAPATSQDLLTPDERAQLAAQLDAIMNAERPYLERGITLPALAERLGVRPHALSYLLNTHYGENFYGFVNGYRVRASQILLVDAVYEHLTIEGIAAEVGFNSKTAFNTNFKRVTGQTPSKYRATVG